MKLTTFSVRKALINNQIVLTKFSQVKMQERGYSKNDLIKCIWTGEIIDIRVHAGKLRGVMEGLDAHNNPIVCVIGESEQDSGHLKVFNLFPQILENYKRVI
ncbi:DUF4258 domain-containing protein [Lysinibacillus sp. CNPSo 3705]|uniref:DUF4258 domain-containing protein n=1 Tax=Lysinibacillus sp. CNPSo 3705 TaxID=3028148 RepID=UPI0023635ADC|nr:DUF4258 domain-containing protein [Lysinibacillus sp. CNPSo 3705]MDD1505534.1 DUF4258 domain-containing protein [Lysinibacillus sp. CNPSo 3705]